MVFFLQTKGCGTAGLAEKICQELATVYLALEGDGAMLNLPFPHQLFGEVARLSCTHKNSWFQFWLDTHNVQLIWKYVYFANILLDIVLCIINWLPEKIG